jgi:serine/threonine protein kinase
MATVFLGRLLGPVGFARTVAIKRLHPQYSRDREFVASFLDEARLVARVRHPNVVPTLDVVASGGEVFLVMEYVHGESLSTLVRCTNEQGQPIPVPIVVAIVSGALQGLDAAHEAKSERGAPLQIVHRDVSPQNILLGSDGQARILDFGIARAIDRLQTTQEGQVKGKVAYMSPEQLHGQRLDATADVYSAAVVLWEAITARRLFRGPPDGRLVVEVLEGQIPRPSQAILELGDEPRARAVAPLDDVIMRGLSRKKDERWQTARAFARALEAAVAPATASQVSDWVSRVAKASLAERAAIVAQIESGSAVDLTRGELGAALDATAQSQARSDFVTAEIPTVAMPPAPSPLSATPDTVVASEPPIHIEAAKSAHTGPPSDPRSAAHAASVSAPPNLGFQSAPPVGTLLSAQSPIAGMDLLAAPPLPRTLQSVLSPLAPKAAPVAPSQTAPEPAEPPEPAPPPRSRAALFVVGLAVVGLIGILAFAIYSHMSSGAPAPGSPAHRIIRAQ